MNDRRSAPTYLVILAGTMLIAGPPTAAQESAEDSAVHDSGDRLEIAVSFDASKSAEPLDGRVLLMLSTNDDAEPRMQISGGVESMQVFGVDVEGLVPGTRKR